MRSFEIKEIKADTGKAIIIFSTSYISPLKYIKEIEVELCAKKVTKQIVFFDFFLSNKNSSERYATVEFNGSSFSKETFKYFLIDKKHYLRKISADFYSNEKDNLDFTFLTTIQKK